MRTKRPPYQRRRSRAIQHVNRWIVRKFGPPPPRWGSVQHLFLAMWFSTLKKVPWIYD